MCEDMHCKLLRSAQCRARTKFKLGAVKSRFESPTSRRPGTRKDGPRLFDFVVGSLPDAFSRKFSELADNCNLFLATLTAAICFCRGSLEVCSKPLSLTTVPRVHSQVVARTRAIYLLDCESVAQDHQVHRGIPAALVP